jgi:uncharacterized membrane protein HdeD (DUF308 family)
MIETKPMPTCKGMMEKPGSGMWMMIPGVLFIALGVLIILYPQILAWFVAIALVVVGIAMLKMTKFMRGIGKRVQ